VNADASHGGDDEALVQQGSKDQKDAMLLEAGLFRDCGSLLFSVSSLPTKN
jgi:hypothetical protein